MKFTNRIIAILLCIVMMSAVACLSVSAVTLLPVGSWVYHEINNYTEVEIYDYNGTNSVVFTPYSNNKIPITTIGSNAFYGNTTMQKITLSQYITTVCSYAFQDCTALKTVEFQGVSVTSIDRFAFSGCTSLSTIALENTLVETISEGAFLNCDSLTEITIPDTVTKIDEVAFGNCDTLNKVLIPATVTEIHEDAFTGSPNVVIHCYENSPAHTYAVENDIEFVLVEDKETYILGDADNDGVVSVLDASFIQMVLAMKVDKPEGFDLRADVESDGDVSIMDATRVQYYIAGLLIDTPIGKVCEY